MPPKPSNNKKRSGKKKEKAGSTSNRERQERHVLDEEEEERLAHEFLTSTSLGRSMAQSEAYRAATAATATSRRVLNPDVPPCDNCSKPFSGTMQCSRCESVFYCDRECQVAHWTASHKRQCATIKQQNDETAKRVIENFTKNVQDWKALDAAGVYEAAVHHGLHDKILYVMQLDIYKIRRRDQISSAGMFFLYTPYVMNVLFRGQRAEGKADDMDYNSYDGVRIKGYVKSHPDALGSWLRVSFDLLIAVADRSTPRRLPDLYRKVHDAAQAVWAGWSLVFASPTASRAVLFVPGRGDADVGESQAAAAERRKKGEDLVRKIAMALGQAHVVVWELIVLEGRLLDPNNLLSEMGMVAAMVHLRAQEYKIGVNVEQVLNLQGIVKQMFHHASIPLAKRTIEKGHRLNPQEASAVMAIIERNDDGLA